jgi:hypothetical protein
MYVINQVLYQNQNLAKLKAVRFHQSQKQVNNSFPANAIGGTACALTKYCTHHRRYILHA